ncbi:conjugal transfer protein TraL [Pseudomonas sp. WS 5096]|uniref:Conjugal transfer protein TraL n=1 Tax=Pseudomonas cremoris TaxID=2724178 RepID=A0ABR6TH62_9PSED|nr:conjugal transfer protein TraL [Pseudomonas cremoris]MBC2385329.1 conjugal transfer protein TraL [Pseudomonas cremoris]
MKKVHMVLQGKGGVAKTLAAILLSQFLRSLGKNPKCFDSDPVNATFTAFKALDVTRIEIMSGDEINARAFDQLIEMIIAHDGDVVVDNGASSFIPLASYMLQNDVAGLLESMGRKLVIHTIITGGQAVLDTLNGFSAVMSQFPDGPEFVVWLNPFFGPIEVDGKPFQKMKVYTDNKDRITGIIQMPDLKVETFGHDLRDMLQDKLTFDEALASDSLPLMVRQRLKMSQKSFSDAIGLVVS